MKRTRVIMATVITVAVLAIAGTAFAAKDVHASLTLSASESTQDSIQASGTYAYSGHNAQYGVKRCGPLAGHPVTLYNGSSALASTFTDASGFYNMHTARLADGNYNVHTQVPGKLGGKYGKQKICFSATSNSVAIFIDPSDD